MARPRGLLTSEGYTGLAMAGQEGPPGNVVRGPWQERLSEDEHRILALLVEGRTKGEIAAELGLSVKAVGKRVNEILKKLRWTTSPGHRPRKPKD